MVSITIRIILIFVTPESLLPCGTFPFCIHRTDILIVQTIGALAMILYGMLLAKNFHLERRTPLMAGYL